MAAVRRRRPRSGRWPGMASLAPWRPAAVRIAYPGEAERANGDHRFRHECFGWARAGFVFGNARSAFCADSRPLNGWRSTVLSAIGFRNQPCSGTVESPSSATSGERRSAPKAHVGLERQKRYCRPAADGAKAVAEPETSKSSDSTPAPAPVAKPAARKPSPAPAQKAAPSPTDPVTLGERYLYGRNGVPQNCERGLRYIKPAADQSNPKAM